MPGAVFFDVDDFQFDTEILNGLTDCGRYVRVGDNGIYISDIGYLAEAAAAEFRRVGQNDGLLCRAHHHLVQVCFAYISGGQAEVEVYAVYSNEQFTAAEFAQRGFGMFPYH